MTLKVYMQHQVLEYYQLCSNDDAGLTLTYLTARSNFVPIAFVWEEGKTIIFSFIDLGPNLSKLTVLNFFSLVTTRQTEAKFHVEPHWDGGTKACSSDPGHMSKMATMPIYGKDL